MEQNHAPCPSACSEYAHLSRRGFLTGSAAATAASLGLPKIVSASGSGPVRDMLLFVFLRGGLDACTAIPPYGDGDLYVQRPKLAIQPPGGLQGALDLDGFFGMAPAMAPLMTAYQSGDLAFVHAAGSTNPSRSHFDAMRLIELGIPDTPSALVYDGWLGRHLQHLPPLASGDLRGVVLHAVAPITANGGPGVLPISDPGAFEFPGNPFTAPARRVLYQNLYSQMAPQLSSGVVSSLGAVDILESIDFAGYSPAHGAVYPTTVFGAQLRNAAAMLKADVGIEMVEADYSGWDLHSDLGPLDGTMAALLADVAQSLAAFHQDCTSVLDRVTVVAVSEFGRQVIENGSLGTDHGRAGLMLVMGGNVNGGQVYGSWPGLSTGALHSGALVVTTDYRDVVAEVLERRMGATALGTIFPGHTPTPLGIVS